MQSLEEDFASTKAKFKSATFNYFYMFCKNNKDANFEYLPTDLWKKGITKCVAHEAAEVTDATTPETYEAEIALNPEGEQEHGEVVDHPWFCVIIFSF